MVLRMETEYFKAVSHPAQCKWRPISFHGRSRASTKHIALGEDVPDGVGADRRALFNVTIGKTLLRLSLKQLPGL
jgi:hypothetical protein